jgi:hypothetical protein
MSRLSLEQGTRSQKSFVGARTQADRVIDAVLVYEELYAMWMRAQALLIGAEEEPNVIDVARHRGLQEQLTSARRAVVDAIEGLCEALRRHQ